MTERKYHLQDKRNGRWLSCTGTEATCASWSEFREYAMEITIPEYSELVKGWPYISESRLVMVGYEAPALPKETA